MNVYKFKYGKTVWTLIAIIIPLTVAGLVWNIFNLTQFAGKDTFKTVTYAVAVALNAAIVFFAVSVAVYGRYVIKGGALYCYFGFIRTKTPIKEATRITHFTKSNKLVMYFNDGKYSVIVISPEFYGDFTGEIVKINPSVITAMDGGEV